MKTKQNKKAQVNKELKSSLRYRKLEASLDSLRLWNLSGQLVLPMSPRLGLGTHVTVSLHSHGRHFVHWAVFPASLIFCILFSFFPFGTYFLFPFAVFGFSFVLLSSCLRSTVWACETFPRLDGDFLSGLLWVGVYHASISLCLQLLFAFPPDFFPWLTDYQEEWCLISTCLWDPLAFSHCLDLVASILTSWWISRFALFNDLFLWTMLECLTSVLFFSDVSIDTLAFLCFPLHFHPLFFKWHRSC